MPFLFFYTPTPSFCIITKRRKMQRWKGMINDFSTGNIKYHFVRIENIPIKKKRNDLFDQTIMLWGFKKRFKEKDCRYIIDHLEMFTLLKMPWSGDYRRDNKSCKCIFITSWFENKFIKLIFVLLLFCTAQYGFSDTLFFLKTFT